MPASNQKRRLVNGFFMSEILRCSIVIRLRFHPERYRMMVAGERSEFVMVIVGQRFSWIVEHIACPKGFHNVVEELNVE